MTLRTVLLIGTASWAGAGLATALCLAPARAQAAGLKLGSSNVAVIEPAISHPNATPCVVPLITNTQFVDFNPVNYNYTPPSACPPPWSVVVLKMHLSLNAGIQYDRSGLLFLDGVPLWFGTTAEPSPSLAPDWQFQKDVTEYTALFESAQAGQVDIGNLVNSTYTGIITASAELDFYPVTKGYPAPVTADVVLPLPGGGGATTLGGPTNTMSITTTFPTNVLQAKADLYLQGQGGDEFWYTCVPNSFTSELESCGGGGLREGEISVDNSPAGVAPVFPWIFTGGIDPLLWQPVPGVQTLDFTPFTADLSPFAGLLSNGQPHTIAVSVYGDNNYFQTTGALRLFLDHGASQVTGAVTENTLAATPTVVTTPNIVSANGAATGTIDTSDTRDFTIQGTVTGSAGTSVYTVTQNSSFANNQRFNVTATRDQQDINQTTTVAETSTNAGPSGTTTNTEQLSWPLTVDIVFASTPAGNYKQTTSINQNYLSSGQTFLDSGLLTQFTLNDSIATADTLKISGGGYITGNTGQSQTASYLSTTPTSCFQRTLAAVANALTEAQTGCTTP
jgi:hypothetical protein